jgi:proteasome lid subunit RPN8/RPN11
MESSKTNEGKTSNSSGDQSSRVAVGFWKSSDRPARRSFPGPKDAAALLRVAVDRAAHAELIAHAKASLDKEICGVLAGTVCEDDHGPFVHVAAVIRGSAASHGSTHVTFTQETWNNIHRTLEQDFPRLQIVGWYHSHPGFGVEFSDMDLFIQRNFFPSPTQIALVTDPLSGATAICVNTDAGIKYVERFWVDGREQICQVPKDRQAQKTSSVGTSGGSDASEAIRALESRVGQLIQAIDDQRASYQRFLLFVGVVVCLGVIVGVGYTYYSQVRYRNEPPQVNQTVPVPIQVGDKTVFLGVGITSWQVPEELNAAFLAVEKMKRLAEEKAAQESTNQSGTNAASSSALTNAPSNKP